MGGGVISACVADGFPPARRMGVTDRSPRRIRDKRRMPWISRAFMAAVSLALPGIVRAQYDAPIDSCACHIHYEFWVQLQMKLALTLTSDFPTELTRAGSPTKPYLLEHGCRDPRNVKNRLEWTLGPANSDCVPGHMSHYILCAQLYLSEGDLEAAALHYDYANFYMPLAVPCMDPAIWAFTPEDFYDRYREVTLAAERARAQQWPPLGTEEIQRLAWRPLISPTQAQRSAWAAQGIEET